MWVAVVAVDISQFNSGCPGESKLQSITDYDDQEIFDTNTNSNTDTNTNTDSALRRASGLTGGTEKG